MHSRKTTNRYDPPWGPNAKGLALSYNIFLEAKGKEVILFSLLRTTLHESCLVWGKEEDTRCSSMGCGLSPAQAFSSFLERTSHHVWEEAGIWEAPNVKAVPWAKQWRARGWVWCLSGILGPNSNPRSQLTGATILICLESQHSGPGAYHCSANWHCQVAQESTGAECLSFCQIHITQFHWYSSWSMVKTFWQKTMGLDTALHVHLIHHESYPSGDLLSLPLLSIKRSHVCLAHRNVTVAAELGNVVFWFRM